MKLSVTLLATTIVLVATAMQSPPATADEGGNATGMCQGALPVYDTELRNRPLAVGNEGGATAYVSCSYPLNADGYTTAVSVYVANNNAAAVDVDCIFVDGTHPTGIYYPKSFTVALGTQNYQMLWLASEYNLPAFDTYLANLSCALPPGVALTYMEVSF